MILPTLVTVMTWKLHHRNIFSNDFFILAVMLIVALAMRFFSFFPVIISHDESTYLEIAREMLTGKIYFVDVTDTKPIGIFFILASIMKLFGKSVFVIRLITALVIGLTAFIIYHISRFAFKEHKPAMASGIIFIFFVSVFTFFGVTINPELYYILFTALGFYAFIRFRTPAGFFFTGILLGTGFMIKYMVVFDFAAFMLYYLICTLKNKNGKTFLNAFGNCVIAGAGFLIPFGIVLLFYLKIGHISEFIEYTFRVSGRYPVDRTIWGTITFIADFHLRFLPVIFFFYYVLFTTKSTDHQPINKLLITIWCLMVLTVVLLPGKPFGHYFIQMMLPVSIYAGRIFSNENKKPLWLNRLLIHPVGTVILIAFMSFNVIMQKHDYYRKSKDIEAVAGYLKTVMKPDETLFTGNYQQILYYLLNKNSPTKFVHRTLLCSEDHRYALQIDLAEEMNAIIQQNITYITMQGPFCYEPFNEYIRANYTKLKEFEGGVSVFRRN